METREKNVCVLPPSANRLPAKPEETRTTGGDGKFFFYLSDSFFFVFFTIFFFTFMFVSYIRQRVQVAYAYNALTWRSAF